MMRYFLLINLLWVSLSFSPAFAKTPSSTPSTKQLKADLDQLKKDYQKRTKELESRLNDVEQANDEAEDNLDQLAIDVSQQSNQKSASTFNPAIGVVLNGRFVNYKNGSKYVFPGFFMGPESGPGSQGFQLGESELNMSANIDDKFFGSSTISFGGGGAAVEEAFIQTLSLGHGLGLKAGRFFSDIGYLTNKHTHTDDFANRPLPYEAFLGGQYGDDGIQATWLAPTKLYWESGTEIYRGDSFPAAGAANSGAGVWTAFTHVGGDIGLSHSWRAGLSYMHADVRDRQSSTANSTDHFTGISQLTIADFVYKWAPQGNRSEQELKLQGEYLFRNEAGTFSDTNLTNAKLDRNQDGWYLQAVYQFTQQWRLGVRTSRLTSGQLPSQFDGSLLDGLNHSPTQQSIMMDWSNSEFSRVRLQADANNLNGKPYNVYTLQYIVAFGAHGAHSY